MQKFKLNKMKKNNILKKKFKQIKLQKLVKEKNYIKTNYQNNRKRIKDKLIKQWNRITKAFYNLKLQIKYNKLTL